jgi:hypothetical protein
VKRTDSLTNIASIRILEQIATPIGAALVPDYRVYVLNDGGHIERPPHIVPCKDDQSAIAHAIKLVDSHEVEVWEGPRLVANIRCPVLRKRG